MDASLLALPWQIQLSLASGYAAYALAYIGIRSHHQTVEIAFRTLVFGAAATLAFHELSSRELANEVWASVGAFAIALLAGFLWRAVGRGIVRWIMCSLRFSFSDDEPSAWAKLGDVADHDCIQIAVRLSDGSWARCDDVRKFRGAPFFPFVLGQNGDVLLYATEMEDKEGKVTQLKSTLDNIHGHRVTYLPSSQISKVNLRYCKRELVVARWWKRLLFARFPRS